MTYNSPTLLLLRPLNDSKQVAKDFEKIGFQTIINPLFKVEDLKPKLSPSSLPKNIIITSRHALSYLKEINIEKETSFYCVGNQTEQGLKDLGYHAITDAPTAKDLLNLLPKQQQYLYLSGKDITVDFSTTLSKCQRLITYQMQPLHNLTTETKQAFENKGITHIAIYSARSAAFFHKLLSDFDVNLKGITFLALGETCATALRDLGYTSIKVAKEPTQIGMLNILKGIQPMATKQTDKQTAPQKAPAPKPAAPPKKNEPPKASTANKSTEKKYLNIFTIIILLIIAAGIYLYQKGYITQYYPLAKPKFTHHSPLNNDDAFAKFQQKTQGLTPPEPENKAILQEEQTEISKTSNKASSAIEDSTTQSNTSLEEQLLSLTQTVQRLTSEVEALRQNQQNMTSVSTSEKTQKNLTHKLKQLSAWSDLKTKISSGAPYTHELAMLKETLSDSISTTVENEFQILSNLATIGIPSLRALYKHFKPIADEMDQKDAFSQASTPLDKAKAFLKQFVSIKKKQDLSHIKPNDPIASKTSRTNGQRLLWKIKQGDLKSVLSDIDTLEGIDIKDPKWAKWLLHAKAYHNVQNTLNTLRKSILN